MSGLVNNIGNVGRKLDNGIFAPVGNAIHKFDPALGWVFSKMDLTAQNFVAGAPAGGRNYYGEGPIAPPGAPTQDTAANAAQAQQDALRRRRGVLSTIYGGGSSSGTPTVAGKSQLGN